MNLRFIHETLPSRVVFRAGALADLAPETARLGSRAFVISTPGQKALGEHCAGLLGSSAITVYDRAVMHTPADAVRAAVEHATRLDADCLIADRRRFDHRACEGHRIRATPADPGGRDDVLRF